MDDPAENGKEAGPSQLSLAVETSSGKRGASKPVSSSPPPLTISAHLSQSYQFLPPAGASATAPPSLSISQIPTLSISPVFDGGNPASGPRSGLKRRVSTPGLARRQTAKDVQEVDPDGGDKEGNSENSESRTRSTSTTLVIPDLSSGERSLIRPANVLEQSIAPPRSIPSSKHHMTPLSPSQPWTGTYITPASRDHDDLRSSDFLRSMYSIGESSVLRLALWVRRRNHDNPSRWGSEDSEKGLDESEASSLGCSVARASYDSTRWEGKYWGSPGSGEVSEDDAASFSVSPTPHYEKPGIATPDFAAALRSDMTSLPTPALLAHSLAKRGSKRGYVDSETRDGWMKAVYGVWTGRGSGKASEAIRDLGWTVGLLVGMFVATAALALWMIQGLPITQLKHLPTSTTDLQLLSAEIRSYMALSNAGWWHTVGVLTFVGCWKHAWSVPGAVVLNILVGSLFEPIPALLLLTIITASGSLFSYLLSRPLAPLIAVLFPKPLALVRAALVPEYISSPSSSSQQPGEMVTPIDISTNPSTPPIGGQSSVWRRLLMMRAMGFVPWSGMNVACGVVGVDWKTFWLTTAAGSASWSYVTASVGNILTRLALPTAALTGDDVIGESLSSLLRDPVLVAKLVFLSALTLLPVFLKRRSPRDIPPSMDMKQTPQLSQAAAFGARIELQSPGMSPLSQSLARFAPMPAAFDMFSFGRTAARQGGRVVLGGVRSAVRGAQQVASEISRS